MILYEELLVPPSAKHGDIVGRIVDVAHPSENRIAGTRQLQTLWYNVEVLLLPWRDTLNRELCPLAVAVVDRPTSRAHSYFRIQIPDLLAEVLSDSLEGIDALTFFEEDYAFKYFKFTVERIYEG